jgi:hypothetical protein
LTRKVPSFATRPDTSGLVSVSLSEFPWDIRVRVENIDGVPHLTGLHLDWEGPIAAQRGRPWPAPPAAAIVTSDRLRRLPLRTLVDLAAAVEAGNIDTAVTALNKHADTWPQGRARPDEHFEEVAAVYRAAIQNRRPPLKDIQTRWKISRAMASKYVRRARQLGYLGAAKTGVAGEVTTPKRKAAK